MSGGNSGTKERRRVVVVGAGLSGLAAARELARQGCEVTLLEQSDRPGGRSSGESVDGFSVERSLPAVYGADRRLLDWIRSLPGSVLLPPRRVQLAQLHGSSVRPIASRTPLEVARIDSVKWREALRLIRFPRLMRRYLPLLDVEAPEKAADLDYRSVSDFASLYFGKSLVEAWIEPSLACYAEPASELSRCVFLLDWLARQEGASGMVLLQGAIHEAARAAAQSLGARFDLAATQIDTDASASLRVHAGPESFEADAVVIATSASVARRIADPLLTLAERDVLEAFATGPEITLSVALDRELTGIPQLIRVPRREGSSIRTLLLDSGGPGLRAPMGGGLASIAASDEFGRSHVGAPDSVIEKAMLAEFERLYPRASGRIRFTRLERHADVVPSFRVGVCRALQRFANVQSDLRSQGRRLYFAGDYLIGPRPENAVASGLRAARALIED